MLGTNRNISCPASGALSQLRRLGVKPKSWNLLFSHYCCIQSRQFWYAKSLGHRQKVDRLLQWRHHFPTGDLTIWLFVFFEVIKRKLKGSYHFKLSLNFCAISLQYKKESYIWIRNSINSLFLFILCCTHKDNTKDNLRGKNRKWK